MSRWTTEAWRRGPSSELLYAAVTVDHLGRFASSHDEIGVFDDFGEEGPSPIGLSEVALECSLNDVELQRRRRALAAHASQTVILAEQMAEATYRVWFRDEHFRRPSAAEVYPCRVPDWVAFRAHRHRERLGTPLLRSVLPLAA